MFLTWYEEGPLGAIEVPQSEEEVTDRKVVPVLLEESGKLTELLEVQQLVELWRGRERGRQGEGEGGGERGGRERERGRERRREGGREGRFS